MKKLLGLMLAMLVLAFALCAAAETYTGEGQGNNGPVTVEVTLEDGAITAVTIVSDSETAGISDPAKERIPAAIVTAQSVAVDTVSGATNTSNAILAAVESCLTQAGLDVEAYRTVNTEEKEQTVSERTVGVLVIGAGGSGLTAASTLKELGADVLLIDKMAVCGGATSLTGALINGGMSHQQEIRGVTDDVNTMFMDQMVYGSFMNDARMAWLQVNNTGAAVDWLADTVGVEFEEALNVFPEHTNDRALYPKGKKPGYLTGTIEAYYRSLGGEILNETKAEHLLFEDGRVTGATCTTPDGILNIHADAVLLATGGYGASVALRPESLTSVLFYGSAASMGEGIEMAREVGAMTHYMEYLKSYPQGIEKPIEGGNITEDGKTYKSNAYISPLASQQVTMQNGAIYVNQSGERCMNENLDFVSIKKATMKQEGKQIYLVMNQAAYDVWFDSMAVSQGLTEELVNGWFDSDSAPIYRKAATLQELAAKAGIDGDALTATVAHFNEMVAAGEDTDFGRTEMSVALEDDGCWYIIEQRLRMATSLGGLKTSEQFEVYDENEQPIPGLYACGETIGGVHGDESMPSNCVSWAVTSGRLSGAAIAEALQ